MLAQAHDIAVDAGPRQAASARLRFCAATGMAKPIEELIRFVVGPDGAPVPDVKCRLPGRGMWITATRQALQIAIARKAFARSFRRDIQADADLIERTERLLGQSVLDALAMCRKAGRTAIGFARVEAALACERVTALLHASEAAPAGRQKLEAALGRRGEAARICVFQTFTSAQLGLALGRSNVIHAALLAGPESETFVARMARLERFRAGPLAMPCGARDSCADTANDVMGQHIDGDGREFANRQLD